MPPPIPHAKRLVRHRHWNDGAWYVAARTGREEIFRAHRASLATSILVGRADDRDYADSHLRNASERHGRIHCPSLGGIGV